MPNTMGITERVKNKYNLPNMHLLQNALDNKDREIEIVLPIIDGVKKQGLSHVVNEKMTEFNRVAIHKTMCYTLDAQKN
jgi:hypothetical protein